MLEARALTKDYNGVKALDALTVTIAPGDVFCLLGANGAGKTTTINLFLNFIEPTEGTALVNGLDVSRHGLESKKFLAYIPETVMLYKNLTGLENLEYFAALAGRPDLTRQQMLGYFTEVGLAAEAADRRVGTYSKGMRQKVGIAIAIAKGARALLLDEPTSSLDTAARSQFLNLLCQVKAEGKTIIFTSHRIEEVEALADEVLIMDTGKVIGRCPAYRLAEEAGLRTQVKLIIAPDKLDAALHVLKADGFTVRRNGVGVLVDVLPREKAQPIHSLSRADIHITDFEVE